ncbi:LmbE family N-acetylglucosaminyl deacetylase [Clostridium neonatale]|uniref:PIG-L deacetylase family protein n=2 Tax=Clostridiaceae TaxID=31979 RepID=UPI0012E4C0A2|nr:PIG-L deacetylase family protein [Clostridium neonatale]MBS4780782.1 PIG-L family deacetylase [Clostridium sp.]CAI3629134.1 LmbE family N-acetylglucosaminyl deacetylase [Clostridium neonatale]SUQ53175.1 N-acetyl-alpha-D-glucosaminyl L-malate deacetylase 1 [Clostridium neonatale]
MNVLVVSPHPDDETLGCGGTLLRLKEEENKIYWLNITNIKVEYGYDKEKVEKRKKEIKLVNESFKFEKYFDLELCPTKLEQYDSNEIIQRISEIIAEIRPQMIILPSRNDVHSDHKAVFDWCFACTKIFRHSYIKKILIMEILSETNFSLPENSFEPTYFFDISNYMEEKINVIKIYESELGEHPFPRSIEAIKSLGLLRGISAGVKYAEAFKIVKFIE